MKKTENFLKLISDLTTNAFKENICIILGAGADIASGGILFSTLKKKCVREMGYIIHDNTPNEEIDRIFNEFFNKLHDKERSNILNKLMRQTNVWSPSEGYQLLVLLAKEHIINSVITTNFDNLMERSEKIMGLKAFQILDAKTVLPQDYILDTMSDLSLYIKMHGDIDNNSVSHLTFQEIDTKEYYSEFSSLVKNILKSSIVIIIGYSGYDTKITEIISETKDCLKNIYWCNPNLPPKDSLLVQRLEGKYTYISTNFDQLMQEVATLLFSNKKIITSNSVFIWTLIKSKIKKLQNIFIDNQTLLKMNQKRKNIITRTQYRNILHKFVLNDKKNLCILTGNSGVGKSMFLAQQCNSTFADDFNIIPITLSLENYKNIIEYVVEELGYITHDANLFILQFIKWCNMNKHNVLFAFDNFQILSDSEELYTTINSILEIIYYARNFENIKFILSLRIEVWNKVLPLIDKNILSKILFQKENSMNQFSSVRIEEFSDNEMEKVLEHLVNYKIISNISYINKNVKELIRNPFFYGALLEEKTVRNNPIITTKELYEAFDIYMINDLENKVQPQKIKYALIEIAGQMFTNKNDKCNLTQTNISEKTISGIIERGLLLLNKEDISFRYTVQMEYYIAQYIYSEILENNDMCSTILNLYNRNFLCSTNYSSFVLAVSLFESDIAKVMDNMVSLLNNSKELFIIQLVHDIVSEVAVNNEEELIDTIILSNDRYYTLFPFILRACNYISDFQAYKIFEFIYKNPSLDNELRKEVTILLADRFSKELKDTIDITAYINSYKKYIIFEQPSEYFIMLFKIISNIGLENINSIEKYDDIMITIFKEIYSIDRAVFDKDTIVRLTESLCNSAYYILFNAGEDLIEKYYLHSQRSIFNNIMQSLLLNNKLELKDIKEICTLASDVNDSISFIKGNLIIIYYSLLNYDKALEDIYSFFNEIDDNTPVEVIDFYLSSLFMMTYIQEPKKRYNLVDIMDKLAAKCSKKYFETPSRLSTKTKFNNEFEQEFEDGFNPLAYYFYTLPIYKDNNTFGEYSKGNLYLKLKKELEEDGDFIRMSRILHVLGQMISIWPNEGLDLLEAFCEYQYPTIRKILIRILKESYLRYPLNTNAFLERTGSCFQEDELKEIKAVSSLHYTKRMMEQLHWARILFFIQKVYGKETLKNIIYFIFQEDILSNLIEKIIDELISPNKF